MSHGPSGDQTQQLLAGAEASLLSRPQAFDETGKGFLVGGAGDANHEVVEDRNHVCLILWERDTNVDGVRQDAVKSGVKLLSDCEFQ